MNRESLGKQFIGGEWRDGNSTGENGEHQPVQR
ncbi:hypothetical protein RKD55_003406 [Rossellomorea marisflavi]